VSATGSNLSRCLQGRPGRCEGRAVRYSNSPSGVSLALTQDETFHPVRSQSNGVAFRGRRIFTIVLGSQAVSVACCRCPQRRYRFGRKTGPKGRRRRLDLSRGRGCRPIRSPSNWSLFRGCPIFGSTLDSLARNVWFATVPCNDRLAASQDGAMRISCQSDLFWRRVQTTGYLYSTPLRSGCRAVDGPHSLLSSPRSQDGDADPQGLAVSKLDRRQATDVVERGRTLGRQSPDRSVERQSRRRQSWLHPIARSCAQRQPSMHEVPGRKVRCPRC